MPCKAIVRISRLGGTASATMPHTFIPDRLLSVVTRVSLHSCVSCPHRRSLDETRTHVAGPSHTCGCMFLLHPQGSFASTGISRYVRLVEKPECLPYVIELGGS